MRIEQQTADLASDLIDVIVVQPLPMCDVFDAQPKLDGAWVLPDVAGDIAGEVVGGDDIHQAGFASTSL